MAVTKKSFRFCFWLLINLFHEREGHLSFGLTCFVFGGGQTMEFWEKDMTHIRIKVLDNLFIYTHTKPKEIKKFVPHSRFAGMRYEIVIGPNLIATGKYFVMNFLGTFFSYQIPFPFPTKSHTFGNIWYEYGRARTPRHLSSVWCFLYHLGRCYQSFCR